MFNIILLLSVSVVVVVFSSWVRLLLGVLLMVNVNMVWKIVRFGSIGMMLVVVVIKVGVC